MAKELLHLKIDGMHCDACVRRLTQALGRVPGVEVGAVQVGEAAIVYDPALADAGRIDEAVTKTGFAVRQ